MGIDAWGNAYHGKIINGDVQLPNSLTFALVNPPNDGETRLIVFDNTPTITLLQQQIDTLLLQGKVFTNYSMLSGGKLYDKQVGQDLWLYNDGATTWKIVADFAVSAGDVQVTLDITRFGEFRPDTPAPPTAITGQVVFNVFTSNLAEMGSHNVVLCDVSPNGKKAIFQVGYSADTSAINKFNYIELSLSGVVGADGVGLIGVGLEIVNQAEGLTVTELVRTNTVLHHNFYKETLVLLDETPPTTSTPNSFIDYSFQGTTKILIVNGGDPVPPDSVSISIEHATPSDVINEGARYTYEHVYWMLYDKDNVYHKYQISIIYDDIIVRTASNSVSGEIMVDETIRQNYDAAGNQSTKVQQVQTKTGNSLLSLLLNTDRNVTLDYDLKRDGVVVTSLSANYFKNVDSDTRTLYDEADVVFTTGFAFGYTAPASPSPGGHDTITGTSVDVEGNSFVYPVETRTFDYVDHFIQMFDGLFPTDSSANFYIAGFGSKPQDIEVFQPSNNLMCLRTGKDLDIGASTEPRTIYQMATPEGFDAVEFTDPSTRINYAYSFNPYTFELVREHAGSNINFM